MILDSARVVAEAFFAGRCEALTSDVPPTRRRPAARPRWPRQLPDTRRADLQGAPRPRGLGGGPSVDDAGPLGAVRTGHGGRGRRARDNVEEVMAGGQTSLSRLSREHKLVARNLGLTRGWVVRAIKAVGNYGEMFERNLGRDSPLGLERGLNRLWNQGG